jgi:hypothetical protein
MGAIKEFHHNEIEQGQRAAIADTRDYPVLFDTEMVCAILSGKKTQTRRLFKSPLLKVVEPAAKIFYDETLWLAQLKNGQYINYPIKCPYGEPGDLLWVKETIDYKGRYKADHPPKDKYSTLGWIPSIHMPKTAARIWLQITGIKAERIQSVSEEDAKAEGCGAAKIYGFSETSQSNFREGFWAKWISIYGIESYYENPWSWVIKFELV